MKNNQETKEKTFVLKLTKNEIAIIKAGLQYYWLDDEFGYAMWGTMPGASFCSHDFEYVHRVGNIYEKLKGLSKVKPDYGYWGNRNRLVKLCQKEFKKAKKEGKEAEKRMFEDGVYQESVQGELDKLGLNGAEILSKAAEVCRKKLELEREMQKKTK